MVTKQSPTNINEQVLIHYINQSTFIFFSWLTYPSPPRQPDLGTAESFPSSATSGGGRFGFPTTCSFRAMGAANWAHQQRTWTKNSNLKTTDIEEFTYFPISPMNVCSKKLRISQTNTDLLGRPQATRITKSCVEKL